MIKILSTSLNLDITLLKAKVLIFLRSELKIVLWSNSIGIGQLIVTVRDGYH